MSFTVNQMLAFFCRTKTINYSQPLRPIQIDFTSKPSTYHYPIAVPTLHEVNRCLPHLYIYAQLPPNPNRHIPPGATVHPPQHHITASPMSQLTLTLVLLLFLNFTQHTSPKLRPLLKTCGMSKRICGIQSLKT